jgi:hypothetical protein
MHLYLFGSLCRGEVSVGTDVDVLAIIDGLDSRLDPDTFSIYSYRRINELWKEGNPFGWHLATEAKLIFASDGRNFLAELGDPSEYVKCVDDCRKFLRLYERAIKALSGEECSVVFELSNIFLAVRNFATCFSLGVAKVTNFSRRSAKNMGERSLKISDKTYGLLERSRILNTRAVGPMVGRDELDACFGELRDIASWMNNLLAEIAANGRVQ